MLNVNLMCDDEQLLQRLYLLKCFVVLHFKLVQLKT